MITKKARIEVDPFCVNPREEGNHVGTMVCWHKRYKLGDVQPTTDPQDFVDSLPEGSLVLPLYLYDHSGLVLRTSSFNDRWDSGQVGFIYTTPKIIEEEFNGNRALAEKYLEGEVEEYSCFLSGDVYGVIIETYNDDELINTESCWGYYGYEYAAEEATLQERTNSTG